MSLDDDVHPAMEAMYEELFDDDEEFAAKQLEADIGLKNQEVLSGIARLQRQIAEQELHLQMWREQLEAERRSDSWELGEGEATADELRSEWAALESAEREVEMLKAKVAAQQAAFVRLPDPEASDDET
uniref:Uncharacterized protein n=1 Tax=Oxyrrhis marina TaxID=2969 RepID=A0A7S3XJN5_OXYMA|mmetsp:Transcript_40695/g.106936  ORF Transcript_40695/g.106936 Transcript_40695/m.106936 type:complete len:129 (+) Transcript_40695:16-402(+)